MYKTRGLSLMLCVLLVGVLSMIHPSVASAATAPTIKVGVVYSVITYNCVNYAGYTLGGDFYTQRCNDVLRILQEDFPDAMMIGDGVLSDLDQLRQYDVIVAPRLLALTGVQRNNIRAYVAEGGGYVGSFGNSRWDFTAGRSPHQYEPLITLWQFSDSWDMSRAWEWGEMSELYQVKFANDPLTKAGYTLAGQPASSHPILTAALARSGGTSLNMYAKTADYNELVWAMPGNDNVTPLFKYANATTDDPSYPANGTLAGWAAPYYFGKVVYFGFQLHDLTRSAYYTDSASMNAAQAVLIESVRWAGTRQTYAPPVKNPVLSATGRLSGGKLIIDETVSNQGEAQLRGYLKVRVYNPGGALVFSGTAKNQPVPLPAGASYTLRSWQPVIGYSPMAGTWQVVCTYDYYDWLRNGTVTVSRTLSMYSTGSSMISRGMGAQTLSGGNRPVIGEQIAGADRYSTAVAVSQRGWPDGVGESKSVLLATGANFPDALSAAPLAGQLDAPVLLVHPSVLMPSVADELSRLYSKESSATLYVVGGIGAVPEAIVDAYRDVLLSAGVEQVEIRRLSGTNRYDTARSIALTVGTPDDGTFADTVIIASGVNYPDALAISPIAAKMQVPILPVSGSYVSAEIADVLKTLGVKHCVIVGGTGVVTSTIETWLESNGYRVPGVPDGTPSVDTRLAGTSRYGTALSAMQYSVSMAGFEDDYLYVATGRNWPDALAFAPLGGKTGNPLVLVDGTDLRFSAGVAEYFIGRSSDVPALGFVGGDSAVTKFVRGKVRIALRQ